MRILYPAHKTVSIWTGTFAHEADFDRCVDGPITATLKLKVPLASICEVSFEPAPIAIEKLLEGFSGWRLFIEEAVRVARQRELDAANSALVCYNLKCEEAPHIWDEMNFLGSYTELKK